MSALALLPTCSIACLQNGLLSGDCNNQNVTLCYCSTVTLLRNVSDCVQLTCNATEQAVAVEAQQQQCAGVATEDRTNYLLINLAVLNGVTAALLVARFLIRWRIIKRFWWDDFAMMVTAIFDIACSACQYTLINLGLGKHIWDVKHKNVEPLKKTFYALSILYTANQFVISMAIIILYLYIFQDKTFRRWCWVTMCVLFALGLLFMGLVTFRCNPLRQTWENNPLLLSECLPYNPILYAGGAANVALDLWILLLPIPQLLGTMMSRGKKLQVILIFNVGVFACITSMIRIKFLVDFNIADLDPTYNYVDMIFWSTMEFGIAFICANLPALKPLLSMMTDSLMSTIKSTAMQTEDGDPLGRNIPLRGMSSSGVRAEDSRRDPSPKAPVDSVRPVDEHSKSSESASEDRISDDPIWNTWRCNTGLSTLTIPTATVPREGHP